MVTAEACLGDRLVVGCSQLPAGEEGAKEHEAKVKDHRDGNAAHIPNIADHLPWKNQKDFERGDTLASPKAAEFKLADSADIIFHRACMATVMIGMHPQPQHTHECAAHALHVHSMTCVA